MPARFHVEGSKPNGLGEPQLITLRKIDHPAWVETVARRRASDEAGAYPEGLWASALRSLAEANAKEGAP